MKIADTSGSLAHDDVAGGHLSQWPHGGSGAESDDGTGSADATSVHDDIDLDDEDSEKEEKLKVVVRVRPLQKNEEPWAAQATRRRGSSEDDEDAHAQSGTRTRRSPGSGAVIATGSAPAAPTATGTTPTTPVESALAIHQSSVSWEKNGQTKILLADAVFDGAATQTQVFQGVEDCVDGLFAGFDCSVFAYGQTGTGKTHTISGLPHSSDAFGADQDDEEQGPRSEMDASLGVVPRCIQKIFEQIDQLRASEGPSVSFALYCSFVEIYNERIYDILSSDVGAHAATSTTSTPRAPRDRGLAADTRAGWNRAQPGKEAPSLQIRQKLDGSVFVDGLTSRRISSRGEMLRAFREGSMNREVRDNLYNQHSSRGHSVFQVTLRKNVTNATVDTNTGSSPRSSNSTSPKRPPSFSTSNAEPTSAVPSSSSKSRLSRLFFVDLAGSEKWHVGGSDLSGKYATELASINKSLSALTNCVLALTQKERTHVPYRDSVLTRLLQSCLQGQGRTAFIVTISPSRDSLEESFATLRFAERLKALRCRPIRRKIFANEHVMGEQRVYYEKQIHSMRLEVNRLRELLKRAQRRNQETTDSTAAAAANVALVEENRRLKELLMHSERNRLVERVERRNNLKGPSKASSASGGVSVDASHTQRQTAKQILASTSRPFSEEEATPRSDSTVDDPSATPPPRHSHGRDKLSTGSTEEQEYSTLVNRLQDKEAHLNWMLEAEFEAQNTRAQSRSGVIPGGSQSNHGVAAGNGPKATVTRSWAVERALQRNLVAVPTPVRGSGATTTATDSNTNTRATSLASTTLSKPHPTQHASAPSNAALVRQRHGVMENHHHTTNVKQDSPRRPVNTRRSQEQPAPHNSAAVGRPSPLQLPPGVRAPPAPSTRAPPIAEESSVQSASILKLVGSTRAEKMGKSKDELVDEYKRARRAELEAMLRTMVHR